MNRDKLKDIYKEYDLEKDDIYMLKFGAVEKPIIKRCGIEKIQNKLNVSVQYKVESLSDNHKNVVIMARGVIMGLDPNTKTKVPQKVMETFGECSPENNTQKYPIAMAEKRALARLIIKMADLHGMHSEDEAEEFKKK